MDNVCNQSLINEQQEKLYYFVFKINEQDYALRILDTQKIVKYSHITVIPHAIESINGIVHVKGEFITVIDLGKLITQKPTVITNESRIIILQQNTVKKSLGIITTSGLDIMSIPVSEIKINELELQHKYKNIFLGSYETNLTKSILLDLKQLRELVNKFID